jgi:hypothetical protein
MPRNFQLDGVSTVPAVRKDFALNVSLRSLIRKEGGVIVEHDLAIVENLHRGLLLVSAKKVWGDR